MKTGIELIAQERQRQIEKKGYTPERDKQYTKRELFIAGCCYLAAKRMRAICGNEYDPFIPPNDWPWSSESWKPSPHNRIRELVKAGALFKADYDLDRSQVSLDKMNVCAAEIDKLQAKEVTID